MKLSTFKKLLLSLGCRQRTADIEHGLDDTWEGVWFDFPAHIIKRKQARKFAQAIRLLLPSSCLMHVNTEEVFGCQIIRVGSKEVERMLDEQAQRYIWGAGDDDPIEEDQEEARQRELRRQRAEQRANEVAQKLKQRRDKAQEN